ncbi:MAG: hypothetical protein HYZ58_17810 [Acidobacteria bacterium]|nr:hypothetical protein [Acidobacteriota bacterium]
MRRALALLACAAIVSTGLPGMAAPQNGAPQKVWTCPMHREVLEERGGICPICKMDLVPTLVEPAWMCPIHAAVITDAPGKCPLDGRELLPVKVEVSWTCPNHPNVSELEPGVCRLDNTPLQRKRSLRPHEDHTPKHGGVFFMAPDTWHHLEGTYPQPGLFRVYVYDNYSQPLDARTVGGRAVLKETYDEATRTAREVTAYALVPSRDGKYLDARVGDVPLPAEITAKVTFDATRPEDRFDFVFAETSKEPEVAVAGAPMPAATIAPPSPIQVTIPDRPGEIAAEIRARDLRVKELLAKGAFADVWVPALEAKDLSLALDGRLDSLPEARRLAVKLAIKQLVRAAWLLDWYADLGDRQQVTEAYGIFASAVGQIASAYQ